MKMMHSFLVLLVEVKEYLCAANFLPPAPWTSLVQVHRGGLGPLYFHCLLELCVPGFKIRFAARSLTNPTIIKHLHQIDPLEWLCPVKKVKEVIVVRSPDSGPDILPCIL